MTRRKTKKPTLSKRTQRILVVIVGIALVAVVSLALTGVFDRNRPGKASEMEAGYGQPTIGTGQDTVAMVSPASETTPEATPEGANAAATAGTADSVNTTATTVEPTGSNAATTTTKPEPTNAANANETSGSNASTEKTQPITDNPAVALVSEDAYVKPSKPAEGAMSLTEALLEEDLPAGAADADPLGDAATTDAQNPASTPADASSTESNPTNQPEEELSWMERAIQANKDRIDSTDLADFRAIIAKLDQGMIYSMANDGFDGEEQIQLKSHMRANLTDGEYERSKGLFREYYFVFETL